ncbi:hypothetical protein CO038_01815 [Candidatus Pacearchaeota archaeon CG_4_9_14_0_2_um_filter_39_13]|nr:hypothetical protein [Candidatus Pacearchaeota archaeon]OIO43117.1 MAG: hypothetical protein AUJ64_02970 [Candidatus Pacearchaeota archaeon CG1_02_39_14]PJC44684.1 MAG: hypothetical protein CO038_01815 [Candidatus Pacearchaeota archaeon CG_4_9_14_0_2_um_filter_39_13]
MKRKSDRLYLRLILLLVVVLAFLIIAKGLENGFYSGSNRETGFAELTSPSAGCFIDFDSQFVINSEASFRDLQNTRLSRCYNLSDWEYDSSKTLLGKKIEASGCSYEMEKRIIRNDIVKKAAFEIDLHTEGECDEVLLSYYEILSVDKIPVDYEVIFELKED